MGSTDIRELGPADDHDQLFDLRTRAFGPSTPLERERWLAQAVRNIAGRRYLAAFEGTAMVAAACFYNMTQWWLGRGVPMAGVASVAVAPEYRGRGVGRALMDTVLGHIAEGGYPLSVLYPATSSIYRSVGWELAGICYEAVLPARSLRAITPEPAAPRSGLDRVTADDAEAVRAVHGAVHAGARDCGPLTWDEAATRHWLADGSRFSYIAPDGFVAYRWHDGNDVIVVDRAIAGSHATTRAIWSLLASSSSIARTVRARVSPAEPFGILITEPDVTLTSVHPWMLRVVHAPAAVAGRGFPAGLEFTVPLRLRDSGRPGNAGDWTLAVGGGNGTLEPSQTAAAVPLTMDVRGFAALYAGTTVPVLRRSGLAGGGDPGGDALLDAAFAAQSFCLDTF